MQITHSLTFVLVLALLLPSILAFKQLVVHSTAAFLLGAAPSGSVLLTYPLDYTVPYQTSIVSAAADLSRIEWTSVLTFEAMFDDSWLRIAYSSNGTAAYAYGWDYFGRSVDVYKVDAVSGATLWSSRVRIPGSNGTSAHWLSNILVTENPTTGHALILAFDSIVELDSSSGHMLRNASTNCGSYLPKSFSKFGKQVAWDAFGHFTIEVEYGAENVFYGFDAKSLEVVWNRQASSWFWTGPFAAPGVDNYFWENLEQGDRATHAANWVSGETFSLKTEGAHASSYGVQNVYAQTDCYELTIFAAATGAVDSVINFAPANASVGCNVLPPAVDADETVAWMAQSPDSVYVVDLHSHQVIGKMSLRELVPAEVSTDVAWIVATPDHCVLRFANMPNVIFRLDL
jgi:hypothetical protein